MDASGKFRGPGTLWTRATNDIVNYFSKEGRYFIKHDKATNELLFVDIETSEVLGYYLDEVKDIATGNITRTIDANYDEIIEKLEKLHRGGTLKTTSIGKTLTSNPSKTTTVLGSFDPDAKQVLDEIGNLKNHNFGAKQGGFNVLNVPDNYYQSAEQFWNDYNKVFLDEAIKRGDDIVLATNPLEINRLFINIEDIPAFTNIEELSEFIKAYDKLNNLKGFGKELQYLFKNEYSYDVLKNVFIK